MSREFVKGTEAMAEAAVRAGCRFFAGYPITPQNEIPEYLSVRLPQVGGEFIQGESEIASIYMVYVVSSVGIRSMTSSSGPGLALKTEGITYLAGAELPAVIIDVARGGPAIGQILPAQQDYLFATKSPGPGGIRCFVFAPSNVQEAVDLVYEAFDIADKYRNPVIVLTDGALGNMMEAIEFPKMRDLTTLPNKNDYILTKRDTVDKARVIQTYHAAVPDMQQANIKMAAKYAEWEKNEQRWEEYMLDDAEIVITAYGTTARIAKSAIKSLRKEGIKAGMIRPITVYPFPGNAFNKLNYNKIKFILNAEMSIPAQMFFDVDYVVRQRTPIYNQLSSGGIVM
ncbi:MAG: 3-methyl-2-oxobutanoate dehydrogenase subunit VorB, partial [Eubacteriaceae bacterium]|nr:3-methyl-2-oxobutanoate dehydrogenase subunit VorB [Eubacteriaceae bacterium]